MVVFGLPHSQRMVGESPGAPLGGATVTPCGPKEGRWDKKTNNGKVMGYMDTERLGSKNCRKFRPKRLRQLNSAM